MKHWKFVTCGQLLVTAIQIGEIYYILQADFPLFRFNTLIKNALKNLKFIHIADFLMAIIR